MKKILTVSVLAMMAVTAANAEIASKGYVDQQTGILTNLQTTNHDNLVGAINELVSNTSGENGLTSRVGALETGKADKATVEPGTHTKITYNAQGIVTGGANLEAGDIPSLTLSKISDAGTAAGKDFATSVTADGEGLPTAGAVNTAITTAISGVNSDVSGLDTRLDTAESDIDALEGLVGNTAVSSQISTAISDMETQTHAGQTYQTLSNISTNVETDKASDTKYPSVKAVDTAITTAISGVNSDVSGLDTRLDTAEGDIDALETLVGSEAVATQITNAIGTGTLTVQMNGASAGTFGANASENATINLGNVITAPSSACTDLGAKCVLTVGNGGYAWEIVERGTGETSGN